MTFNDNANVGGSTARRRGGGAAIAGGGIAGIGAIAVLLFQLFTGQDISGLVGGGGGAVDSGEATRIEQCQSGADANARDDCRLAAGQVVLDEFWAGEVQGYTPPQLFVVDGATNTQCGTASNQTGPFYCPPEQAVYVDPTFFGLLRQQFDATAGPLAQLYVLAHEYGHHVQNIAGIMQEHSDRGTGPDSDGVRLELQADCFAGAFIGDMTEQVDEDGVAYLKEPTQQQIADAINAAQTVGDDHIQQQSGGGVNPETWTHGSSEQRQRWFETGYRNGVASCETFGIPGGSL
ncbi:neutral zinc metallopeptidase [Microbacterium sp. CFH 31415]|uniref:KPN_02809 family neutral zinc metallopeptidase n=1 Tax=Microbacterium sp. CFH 31415 TaxID=2921732 RepID=UPI001F132787|nr:neutral zinc metallopeptidase [Microbacterium sp. CFH 31415]MCH6230725.1 neutral zinc metallopeptidase [Microbacterium sp. CFH 31415]